MKGLTSKEHLYLRIVSIAVIINALVFYAMSRNLAFVSNLFEAAVLLTSLTLVVLVVNVEFWWRYLRRSDNKRFWKPQTKEEMN
jgi:heme/copper-type cytochrome/quinol oxidase subunit 2